LRGSRHDIRSARGARRPQRRVDRREIGAYVVVAPVGRGGMGVVYLADDRRLADGWR
jgi:hypothetical protein